MKALLTLFLSTFLFVADLNAETFTKILGDKTYLLEEAFYDDFSGDLTNWSTEGDAKVGVSRDWLEVDCGALRGVAATIWCKREFEGSQLVEYDVRLMPDSRQSNINMFLMASIPDGPGILETGSQRSGKYSEYHVFPNYLITILNGTSPAKREMLRLRMRLDPGFQLVAEKWLEPLVFGRVYHIAYLIQSPRVSVYINGKKAVEHTYEKSLNQGMHGLRIWSTHSIYDNFRVSRIVK
jgi:Domain of unknown function (DUF6250)